MSKLYLSTPVLLVLILATCHANAQQDQGTITGRVTDATSSLISGAAVAAFAIETGVSTQTVTNAVGFYTLPALKIGHYRIIVEMPGFKRGLSDVVEVHAQDRVRVDFELELGSLDEAISVL